MSKYIQSIIIAVILLFGAVAPTIVESPVQAQAAPKNEKTIFSSVFGVKVNDKGDVTTTNEEDGVKRAFDSFLNFVNILSGGGALLMLMFFVINFIKLGAAGTNSKAREAAIQGLVWSGIATACLSMASVIFLFFSSLGNNISATEDTSSTG